MEPKGKVYKKLGKVQGNLLQNHKFKKSGKNKYGGFNYFELEDLLPPIVKECFENGLLIEFSFSDNEGILKVRDIEDPGIMVSNRVPLPELEEMPRMNIIQSLGSYITYIKRYLLMNTFHICEESYIDSDSFSKNGKVANSIPNKNVVKKEPAEEKQRVYPQTVDEYIEVLTKKLEEKNEPVTRQNLLKQCTFYKRRNKDFVQVEREVKKEITSRFTDGGK